MRNPRLAQAIALMRETLEDPLPATRIAAEIGLSSRQLERLFGKHLNTTPKKYYMELRLERARLLLLQTEMSVSEVAYGCGFESPGHFARVFKTTYGISPVMQRSRLS
jgi:transcriptional regulator GlxA family with amidase domain